MDLSSLNNNNFEIDIRDHRIDDIVEEINLVFEKILEIK